MIITYRPPSGSGISAGASTCMHLFTHTLKMRQLKLRGPHHLHHTSGTYMWFQSVHWGCMTVVGPGRVFSHLLHCCTLEQTHFYGAAWDCFPCRPHPLVVKQSPRSSVPFITRCVSRWDMRGKSATGRWEVKRYNNIFYNSSWLNMSSLFYDGTTCAGMLFIRFHWIHGRSYTALVWG